MNVRALIGGLSRRRPCKDCVLATTLLFRVEWDYILEGNSRGNEYILHTLFFQHTYYQINFCMSIIHIIYIKDLVEIFHCINLHNTYIESGL